MNLAQNYVFALLIFCYTEGLWINQEQPQSLSQPALFLSNFFDEKFF